MTWFRAFAEAAEATDQFIGRTDHLELLTTGLLGEAGSVLAELKKERREREAYPAYRRRMLEEIGDFAWYFVRITSLKSKALLEEFEEHVGPDVHQAEPAELPLFLEFGAAAGALAGSIARGGKAEVEESGTELRRLWTLFCAVCRVARVDPREATAENTRKIRSRFSQAQVYRPLFDAEFPEEEQLPRRLEVEFRERTHGERRVVILRCNGINFGDRITDNIQDPDGYRYHDVFHFAHAVHLGWSPVVRALLRCKRKSSAMVDEAQDGARAGILEEAIAAVIFSRAKELRFFRDIQRVDYDLLKTVKEFVSGFEVEDVPLWQWEIAILDGYRVFRKLRENSGGYVSLNLERRELAYTAK